MTTALVIHGHFYQPPRENPWSGRIDREPSAAPFRDWNERIHSECYRPNGVARIVDERNRVLRIVNNYEWLSFNVGPTLLSWMAEMHPRAYERVLAGDRASLARLGHGNAIAQGYNHAILPLLSPRDRVTQVRWGLADFRSRFAREAESLWMPETACDVPTLETLAAHGMKYAILAPHQAARVRPIGGDATAWKTVGGAVDPSVPYRWVSPNDPSLSLVLFFYDGPISRGIAFEGLLASSEAFVSRCARAAKGDGHVVHVATDGESYGHHFKWGDRCVAYAMSVEAAKRGFHVTNYAALLDELVPAHEVELAPGENGEGTAWSCAHGLGRWARDCGCSTGGRDGWNQRWRTPLRTAMHVVRDAAAAAFESAGGDLFADPWAARDAYIDVLTGTTTLEAFFARHGRGGQVPHEASRVRARALLEAQRHSLLSYTSCGWFFSDISGIETLQCLRYAARAMELLEEAGCEAPRAAFLATLAEAKSNVAANGTGADVFRTLAAPSRVTMESVAAHLAISAVATGLETLPMTGEAALHAYEARDVRRERAGTVTLGTGRVRLTSRTTGRVTELAAAAAHLGGVDFVCAVKPLDDATFAADAQAMWSKFPGASLPTLLRLLLERFGPEEYGLEHVLPGMRERISHAVLTQLIERLAQEYARVYDDNLRTIDMLSAAGFPLPAELRAPAELALSRRFAQEIEAAGDSTDPAAYGRAVDIVDEAMARGLRVDRSHAADVFARRVEAAAESLLAGPSDEALRATLDVLMLARRLGLSPSFDRAQEAVYAALVAGIRLPGDASALLDGLVLSPRISERTPRPSSIEPPSREGAPRP